MPTAARVMDSTTGPGIVAGPGVNSVQIGGVSAAIGGDIHTCSHPAPHPPTTFLAGSGTVLIGGRPALRVGDSPACGGPIAAGATNVQIGG